MRLNTVRTLVVGTLLASGVLLAQVPRIGIVDFYGVHRVSQASIRKALGSWEGDPLPASKLSVEDRLEQIPGVAMAHLEAVCCAGDRAILYVGIEERDGPRFPFHAPPTGEAMLPDEVVAAYHSFLQAFENAARSGQAAEDISQGHALAAAPEVRAQQERFPALAQENLAIFEEVLHESADPEQRAIAAYMIGYAPPTQATVDELQYAMQDADQSVRTNAMRALMALSALSARKPALGIRVQPTWFVEMLNSIAWNDRYRTASALVTMTESRPRPILDDLREHALPSLVEMARWKTLPHALPAFILTGRIAGLPEKQIHEAWNRGDRETVIKRALRTAARAPAARRQ